MTEYFSCFEVLNYFKACDIAIWIFAKECDVVFLKFDPDTWADSSSQHFYIFMHDKI